MSQIRSFFWSVFSCIQTEYGYLLFGQFSCSVAHNHCFLPLQLPLKWYVWFDSSLRWQTYSEKTASKFLSLSKKSLTEFILSKFTGFSTEIHYHKYFLSKRFSEFLENSFWYYMWFILVISKSFRNASVWKMDLASALCLNFIEIYHKWTCFNRLEKSQQKLKIWKHSYKVLYIFWFRTEIFYYFLINSGFFGVTNGIQIRLLNIPRKTNFRNCIHQRY